MAKFSMKQGGKEVGPASVYAKPHTMSGKTGTGAKVMQDPNKLAADKMTNRTATPRVSMGDPAADDVKTSGIKIRGTGCATKGLMARGPMA
jgi:hypothetical protein